MKLIALLAFATLLLLVCWMMYGQGKPPRRDAGEDSSGWLPGGDTAGAGNGAHPHAHPADVGADHGGFDGGGQDSGGGGHH